MTENRQCDCQHFLIHTFHYIWKLRVYTFKVRNTPRKQRNLRNRCVTKDSSLDRLCARTLTSFTQIAESNSYLLNSQENCGWVRNKAKKQRRKNLPITYLQDATFVLKSVYKGQLPVYIAVAPVQKRLLVVDNSHGHSCSRIIRISMNGQEQKLSCHYWLCHSVLI